MTMSSMSQPLLEQEARALLTRLDQVKPLALNETMVLAAALPAAAQLAIERFLHAGRGSLRSQVNEYLRWIRGAGRTAPADEQQRKFVLIRLRFNAILSQLDTFVEVVTQRSEHDTGVWLAGLDVLAADALSGPGLVPDAPPVICYLARGPGAAIRRARTRLAGGELNPVAIVRVPRERMVGHGIASSLVHEVGHQAAALLGLVESLRPGLTRRKTGDRSSVWVSWDRWISEIVADLWSVGTLGISSTLGLLAVVSLPKFFIFRPSGDDPHPVPYVRLLLSAAIGNELYPHPQWESLTSTWKQLYPVETLPEPRQREFAKIEAAIPEFVRFLVGHRPPALGGRRLRDIFPLTTRQPDQLLEHFARWGGELGVMARRPPTLVFAAVGQARAAQRITPEDESRMLADLLRAWALRSSVGSASALGPSTPLGGSSWPQRNRPLKGLLP